MNRVIHAALLSAFLVCLPLGAAVAVAVGYMAYGLAMLYAWIRRARVDRQAVADYTRDFLDRLSDESRGHG